MKNIYRIKFIAYTMSLPSQFMQKNFEDILIYHYVEELVSDFSRFSDENYGDELVSPNEIPFLLRIRFQYKSTQRDLVKLFHVSNGQASKILRKFEDRNLIQRKEDPESRRRKIVKLTPEGIEKTDKILEHITAWENSHNLNNDELKTLKKLLFKFLSE